MSAPIDVAAILDEQDRGAAWQEHLAERREQARRESDAAEIARLAGLPPIEYDRARKDAAKKLGVRPTTLDAELAKLRAQQQQAQVAGTHENLAAPAPEPWGEPVAGAALLSAIASTLTRFLSLPASGADAIALWVLFSHCFGAAEVSPRLFFQSPTKRCGKSTAMAVVERLVPSALAASSITPSALFRSIDTSKKVSLFIDEADAIFRSGNEELRALLNAGHTPDHAFVVRSVPVGDKEWAPHKFSVWCPIVIAAIGNLPDTVEDRSIIIPMRRRHGGESLEPARRRTLQALAPLTQKAARWAADNLAALREAPPPAMPDTLNDRAADSWEPLIAIADRVGGDWPDRARKAALALSGDREHDSETLAIELLRDIRAVFQERDTEWIASRELVEALVALDSRPWGEISRGRPLTPNRLARMLRSFGVYFQRRHAANGYALGDLQDAFLRYIPSIPPAQTSKPPQTLGAVERNDDFRAPANSTLKSAENLTESETCGGLEVSKGGIGECAAFSAPDSPDGEDVI